MKTMKLKDVIKNINFEDKNIQSDIDWEGLGNAIDIPNYWSLWFEQERLKAYFIQQWLCTDSWVGVRAYFLDGKIIAVSSQLGRKMGEDFAFTSKEDAEKLKAYIQSLINEEEDEIKVEILDLEQELKEFYSVNYNTEILHKHAIYDGHKVEIVKRDFRSEDIGSINYFYSVEVKFEDGKKQIVDCRQLLLSRFSLD